jgi:heme/copper-type cytochrome/quinol oxidase subunit 4
VTFVRLIPVFLSALLLGAHFLRSGQTVITVLIVLFPVILLMKRAWAARATQIVLFLGGIEWIRTLLIFVAARREADQPWTRLAVILGIVALFTIGSGLLFSLSGALRKRYRLEA